MYIIASAFKFKLLLQPQPAGQKLAAPGGYISALPIIVRATASLAETSDAWWIFLLSSIFRFSIAVSRLVLQHRK